jgi:hypothetical protein
MRYIRALVAQYAATGPATKSALLQLTAGTIAMQLRSMKRLYIVRGSAALPILAQRELEAQFVERAIG